MKKSTACLALLCAVLLLASEVHGRDLLAPGGNGKGNGGGNGNAGGRGKPVLTCTPPCATCNGQATNCKTCVADFALQGNRCIKCAGENMSVNAKNGRCQCAAGYDFNKDKTACVKKTTDTTTPTV